VVRAAATPAVAGPAVEVGPAVAVAAAVASSVAVVLVAAVLPAAVAVPAAAAVRSAALEGSVRAHPVRGTTAPRPVLVAFSRRWPRSQPAVCFLLQAFPSGLLSWSA
jgi:hypothetical protein